MATLTVQNAIIMLSVSGLYPTPQQLQGFSADNIFDADEIDATETSMGVDGTLSGGLINVEKPWSVMLQSNSASNSFFDNLIQSQKAVGDYYTLQGTVTLLGLGTSWSMNNGILKKYPTMPSAHKIAQPRKYTIVWESITPSSTYF